jgi:dipeptidase E
MRLLLVSNSTNAGEPYLAHCIENIRLFLGENKKRILFIPFAAVTFSYDEYEKKVKQKFGEIGYEIVSIHKFDNAKEAIQKAEAIVVGGGNTFALLNKMYELDIIGDIRLAVEHNNIPYIGWSAGSNLACPTIKTTNDMPIIEPKSFEALHLVDFQINPHFIDANPEGFAGETRQMRIEEFVELNRNIYVVGLREGTMLQIENKKIRLFGNKKARIFKYSEMTKELGKSDDFSFLLTKKNK